jgi:hypothetical protein
VNDAPVIFPGHRIEVSFSQKTLIVCVHQLVDGVGVAASRVVEKLNRARVLAAAMDGLFFFVPANRLGYLGCGNRQRERDQQDHEEDPEQQEAPFLYGSVGSVARRIGFCHH